MKAKAFFLMALMVVLQLTGHTQQTEKRFGFELNTGLSIATNKIADASLNPGFGFEGTLHYHFAQHTGLYAGWGWNRFGANNSFAGSDICIEETGYVIGLQYQQMRNQSFGYFVRLGMLYNHLEIENNEGDIIHDTGHGPGFQLAGGLVIPLSAKWNLMPGVKFNALKRDLTDEGTTRTLKQNYLQIRVGFVRKF